jgi:hypothetical protein
MIQPASFLPTPAFKAKSSAFSENSKKMPRFSSTETKTLKKLVPSLSGALKHFDFRDPGVSHMSQIQLVYAICILWRLVAANQRRKASPTQSWNEIRESLLRDSVGYAFWFFGTPTLQRLYLKLIPKDYQKALIHTNPPNNQGAWQQLKQWNPISRFAVPTSEQIKDMKAQAINHMEEAGLEKSDEAFQKIEAYYKTLMTHRNVATGIGLLSTIGLLGIGINYLNFYLTNRNIKQREMALLKPPFPEPPRLPKFQPIQSLPAFTQQNQTAPQQPNAGLAQAPTPFLQSIST